MFDPSKIVMAKALIVPLVPRTNKLRIEMIAQAYMAKPIKNEKSGIC